MRSRKGPPDELVSFCTQEHEKLVRILGLYCGSTALAEELAQEALIKVCREWPKVRSMEHPRAWLHKVGMNLANSHFRRKAAERRATQRADQGTLVEFPDHADAVTIRAVVSALSKRQRAVLLLHYFDDLTYAQTAEVLGYPENTVKSLARRGLAALRANELQPGEMNHAF